MKKLIIAVAAIVALAARAGAQDIPPALDPTTMIGYAGTVAADQYARREYSRQTARRASASTAASATALRRLSYSPDPAVRQRVHARVLQQIRHEDPAGAAKLAPFLARGTFDRQAAAYLARYGMSTNNVADATALFLVSSWLATRASDADPTLAQLIGVRNQVAAAMAASPGMIGASNAMKQEIAEANLIQAVLTGQFASAANQDPRLAPAIRAAAATGVRNSYGLDLLALRLTPGGFRN